MKFLIDFHSFINRWESSVYIENNSEAYDKIIVFLYLKTWKNGL